MSKEKQAEIIEPVKLNLCQKLVEIRKELKYLQKGTKSYNFNYVKGADILSVIRPVMDNIGVLMYPKIIDPEPIREITVKTNNGTSQQFLFEAVCVCVWRDADTSEVLEIPFYCTGTQEDSSKAFGSALTYTERYFLLKFFNIPTDEDDPDRYQEKHRLKKEEPKVNTGWIAVCKKDKELGKSIKETLKLGQTKIQELWDEGVECGTNPESYFKQLINALMESEDAGKKEVEEVIKETKQTEGDK